MTNSITVQKILKVSCAILISLVFISKVSLKWTKIIPSSLPPVIFQYGIHPYINFLIQFVIALVLIFIWIKFQNKNKLSKSYKIFIYTLITVLTVQTIFQITLVNISYSIWVQLGGLGMAIMLILLYGVIIPSLLDIKLFVSWVRNITVFLVITSVLCLPLFYPDMFKGGRFVGLFKHIPHMVTASTCAFIFLMPKVFDETTWTYRKNTLLVLLGLILLALAVLLTSTKAAFITVVITVIFGIVIFKSYKFSFKLFKFAALLSLLISILLLGIPTVQFMYDISTGKMSFGLRPAQDGVQTRMEEVTRGWNMFERSPYFGLGLLYKFLNNSKEGIEVESYNSFKDPHNLFVSSAVIGGYPLLVLSGIGYLFLILGAIRGMMNKDVNQKLLGLFLLAHLPVFVIYHAHFSLGGMGDRLYWLVFGYLGILRQTDI
jgi:O-antigen ligase